LIRSSAHLSRPDIMYCREGGRRGGGGENLQTNGHFQILKFQTNMKCLHGPETPHLLSYPTVCTYGQQTSQMQQPSSNFKPQLPVPADVVSLTVKRPMSTSDPLYTFTEQYTCRRQSRKRGFLHKIRRSSSPFPHPRYHWRRRKFGEMVL
jgi:hypothetical protein